MTNFYHTSKEMPQHSAAGKGRGVSRQGSIDNPKFSVSASISSSRGRGRDGIFKRAQSTGQVRREQHDNDGSDK